MKKRIISFITAFILSMNAVTANISAVTVEQALEWARAQIGTYYDYDGIGGSSCVDLVFGYFEFFGVDFVVDNTLNLIAPGFTRYSLENAPGGIQPGDVFIRIGEPERANHVGIIVSVIDNERFTAVEANSDGLNCCCQQNTPVRRITREAYPIWGVLRPAFSDEPGVSIFDALEILKYLAGLDSTVDFEATIYDALEILKQL
jgi:hypothetical protein